METAQLLPTTRALLANCDLPLSEIAQGAGVGLEWLKKFKNPNTDHDHGVNRVQALHDYLASIQHETTRAPKRASPAAQA